MHSSKFGIHLEGEIPKVNITPYSDFYTVDIIFDISADTNFGKSTVTFYINTEQELVNFKNNFLQAFESFE